MCDRLPDQDELNGILSQYYALIVERMTAMGFDIHPAAPQSALAEFWAHSEDAAKRVPGSDARQHG